MVVTPKKSTFDNLAGKRFTRLLVISYEGQHKGGANWLVRCDCGEERVVKRRKLLSGEQKSCGCLRREAPPRRTHGMAKSPEYTAWAAMKARCSNPKNRIFHLYGGRGITVCDQWAASFENFLKDMGPRPAPDLSIDRINNDGNYEPGNCRWADKPTQSKNRRTTSTLCLNGETKTLSEWADIFGVGYRTVKDRINRLKWSAEKAVTTKPLLRASGVASAQ
jgi:hypothetical protein